jgi:putative ABC transport system ATP-binding protein
MTAPENLEMRMTDAESKEKILKETTIQEAVSHEETSKPEMTRESAADKLMSAFRRFIPGMGSPSAHSNIQLGDKLIEMHDIYKIYKMGGEEVHANDGISLDITHGEFVSIVGKSGSGKSTLMNIIGALDVPTSGTYFLGGENVGEMTDDELADIRNRMIGFVFQQYNLLPKLSILENVELPLLYAHIPRKDRADKAKEALAKVGLADKVDNRPNQLSGGQQQRVSIARALAANPRLLLADEPTGALDSKTSVQILDFFAQLNAEGNTVIMITHDNSIAVKAHRVVQIMDGRITFDGKAKEYERLIHSGS